MKVSYTSNIIELIRRQRAKGLAKYGLTLEDNTTLTTCQRIEHAQEELVDALQYLEHLKQTQKDHLTANDYQRAVRRVASDLPRGGCTDHSLLLLAAMNLSDEAREVSNHVKRACFRGYPLHRELLVERLGNAACHIAICCEELGVTLEDVLQGNIDKLRRRCPEGFDKARSVNRTE